VVKTNEKQTFLSCLRNRTQSGASTFFSFSFVLINAIVKLWLGRGAFVTEKGDRPHAKDGTVGSRFARVRQAARSGGNFILHVGELISLRLRFLECPGYLGSKGGEQQARCSTIFAPLSSAGCFLRSQPFDAMQELFVDSSIPPSSWRRGELKQRRSVLHLKVPFTNELSCTSVL
jgi:hypothetical protein